MTEPHMQLRAASVLEVDFQQPSHVLRRTHYPISYRAPERRQAMLELPTPKSIRAAVCEVYGIVDAVLNDNQKSKTISEARHVAVWFMRRFMKMSYPELGREIARDHSSVISAIHRIDRQIQTQPLLCSRIASIADKLRVKL
jgi:chromosomal replication initiation ATPase DnaA